MFKEEKTEKDKSAVDIDYIARYKGQVKNCLRDGEGTYKFAHGGNDVFSYEGTWSKGVRESTNAKFSVAGYSQYTGEFKKGEITGVGKRSWADGRSYEGSFQNGEMHGKGRWVSRTGTEIYDGDFVENKRQGFGTLKTGINTYTGEFFHNQMHGAGTYECGNNCYIKSIFDNNIMNGPSFVRWNKVATMDAVFVNGRANGPGYFLASDGSYDYEGGWTNGYPDYKLISKYIWCDIEKPAPPPEPAGKKAPPPAAKSVGPPSIVQGDGIGRVLVKTSPITLAVANAPAVPAAPVKGKAPPKVEEVPKGTIPEPEAFAVPCERQRRVTVRLRRITNVANPVELTDSDIGTPVNFWIRNQNYREASSDRTRFPASCTLYIDGECAGYGSTISAAPPLVLEPENTNAMSSLLAAAESCDEVSAVKVDKGVCLALKIPCHELKKSNDSMTFVVDFKVDVQTLSGCFRQALMQSKIIGTGAQSVGPARKMSSNSSKRRMSGSRLLSGGPNSSSMGSMSKQHIEIPILSLHRVHEGDEISSSRLQLVLIVPDTGLKRMAKKIVKMAKGVTEEASGTAVGASSSDLLGQNGVGLGNDAVDVDWVDCSWELRLVTYASGNVPTPAVSHTVLEHDLKEVDEEADTSQKLSSAPSSRRSSFSGGLTQLVITSSVVCGRWKEPPFACAQWHSIALTLRANTTSALYNPNLFGENGFLSQNPASSELTSSVVSLVVDGALRQKAPLDVPRKLEMPSLTLPSAPNGSTAQLVGSLALPPVPSSTSLLGKMSHSLSQAEFQEGTLLAWLPEKPAVPVTQNAGEADGSANEPAADLEFNLVYRVGGDYFMGYVKALAVCTEGDRADPLQMTKCFEMCREQERLLRPKPVEDMTASVSQLAILAEDAAIDSDVSAAVPTEPELPCPPNHRSVQELPLMLTCGSLDFNRIVVPSYTPEGDYVLEVTDTVSTSVHTTCAPVPDLSVAAASSDNPATSPSKPGNSKEPTEVTKMVDAAKVVTALPISRQLKFRVVKAP